MPRRWVLLKMTHTPKRVPHTPTPKAVEIEDEQMEEEPAAPMSSTGVDASKEVVVPEVEMKKASVEAEPSRQPHQPVAMSMEVEGAAAKAEVNVEPEKAVSSEKEARLRRRMCWGILWVGSIRFLLWRLREAMVPGGRGDAVGLQRRALGRVGQGAADVEAVSTSPRGRCRGWAMECLMECRME